jgi:hypothetical protein
VSKQVPNDVVGETVSLQIGSLDGELKIDSFEHEWTTVTYKPNRVHVHASTKTSNRTEGIVGSVEFTVTEQKWRELNEFVRRENRG